jgi:fibronectin-binding autotransporter adhesin
LNFVGKFDAKLPVDGWDAHQAHVHHIESSATHVPADAIVVPDAQLLFEGDYKRSGVDLILSNDERHLVLHDYFKGEKRAALSSPDGAHLTGDIVNALSGGHVEYAQAAGAAAAAEIIGHVTKLTGTATAIRNGVSIILNQGDNVEKGDVIESGSNSTVGVTFKDGSVFGLSSNARMVLNEMVYDPNGSNNSSLISLVAGTISFVAGETAKHGDMKVDTPVATMGIRGTAVLVEIDFSVPGQNGAPSANFQVLVEPDGSTGSYILFDKQTLAPIATVNQAGQLLSIHDGTVTVSNASMTPDIQKLINDVFTQKFTDNSNQNTKTATNFTDTVTPQYIQTITAPGGATATPIVLFINPAAATTGGQTPPPRPRSRMSRGRRPLTSPTAALSSIWASPAAKRSIPRPASSRLTTSMSATSRPRQRCSSQLPTRTRIRPTSPRI